MLSTVSMAGLSADQRIAAAQRQAPVDQQGDAAQVVGRMVGLQPRRQRAGQAESRASLAWHAEILLGDADKFVYVADFGHGRGHYAGQGTSQACQLLRRVREQAILQCADRPIGNCARIAPIDSVVGTHHVIHAASVVGERAIVDVSQCERSQNHAGHFALLFTLGRQSGMTIAGFADVSRAEQGF